MIGIIAVFMYQLKLIPERVLDYPNVINNEI